MLNKTLLQGLAIVILFFGMYFGLRQVDFITIFSINEARDSTEAKLGDMVWEQIEDSGTIILNDSILDQLDKLILPICKSNGIERDSLKIHLVKKDEVNAFALPNSHVVVYTGLIDACRKQEALQGVIGHEIAHIENNHVMRKLSKEIGLSVLINGGNGANVTREVLQLLSSSAYDRSLEQEADREAVNYLTKAGINPDPLADLMYELSMKTDMPDAFQWIATHPDAAERAKYILEFAKHKGYHNEQTLTAKEWENFKKAIKR